MLRMPGLGDNVVNKYMHIRTIYPGGNALNSAVYAKMFGIEVGYPGVFGGDGIAAHVYDTIRGLGLELSHYRLYPGEGGYAEVRLDNGDRVLIDSNKGGVSREHPLELTAMGRVYTAGYDIIHTSIFSHIEDKLPLLRQASSLISMGFPDRADGEYLRQCAPYVDYVSISCGNIPRNKIERQMTLARKFGYRHTVIATRGAKGALVMVDGRLYERSSCLVEAVDTMGTGDSFITCFLINYVDAIENSRGFPAASGTKEMITAADYQDLAVRISLYRAVVYLAGDCQKSGSFRLGEMFQSE